MGGKEQQGLSWVGRAAAVGALLLAVLAASWLLLGNDDGYTVKARFQAATNVVKGNLVQVGGRKVGTIEDIQLADDGEAELTLKIDDERRSEEHTSELQSRQYLVCRLLLEKK